MPSTVTPGIQTLGRAHVFAGDSEQVREEARKRREAERRRVATAAALEAGFAGGKSVEVVGPLIGELGSVLDGLNDPRSRLLEAGDDIIARAKAEQRIAELESQRDDVLEALKLHGWRYKGEASELAEKARAGWGVWRAGWGTDR